MKTPFHFLGLFLVLIVSAAAISKARQRDFNTYMLYGDFRAAELPVKVWANDVYVGNITVSVAGVPERCDIRGCVSFVAQDKTPVTFRASDATRMGYEIIGMPVGPCQLIKLR